jgi:hypothetical protein
MQVHGSRDFSMNDSIKYQPDGSRAAKNSSQIVPLCSVERRHKKNGSESENSSSASRWARSRVDVLKIARGGTGRAVYFVSSLNDCIKSGASVAKSIGPVPMYGSANFAISSGSPSQ